MSKKSPPKSEFKFRFELTDTEETTSSHKRSRIIEFTHPAWDYKEAMEYFPEHIIAAFFACTPADATNEDKLEVIYRLFWILKEQVDAQIFGDEHGTPASERFFNKLAKGFFLTEPRNKFDGQNGVVEPELQEGKPRENPLNGMFRKQEDDSPEYDTGSGWVDPQ